MKNFYLKYAGIFFWTLLALTICYLPSLTFPYAYHDDFRFWQRPPHQLSLHVFYFDNIVYGRLLSSYLLTIVGWCVNSVSDLNLLRFLNVVQLSVCAVICMHALKKYFADNIRKTFLAVIIIFTLPPFQVMVSYAAYFFLPFTMILAAVSAGLTNREAEVPEPFLKQIIKTSTLIPVILLFFAFTTYVSTAVFYWFVGACYIMSSLSKKSASTAQLTGRIVFVGFAALLLYALYLHLTKRFFSEYVMGMYDPYNTTMAYGDKLMWFVNEPLSNSLSLWNIFPGKFAAIPAALFILSGVVLSIRKNQKQTYMYLGLFGFFLLMSFLPNLAARGNAAFYRCCSGLTAFVVLAMIWSLNEWLSFLAGATKNIVLLTVLLITALFGVFQAQKTVLTFRVIPSYLELNYIENILRETDLKGIMQIHLVPAKVGTRLNRFDEYGMRSTVFPQDFHGILLCALREAGKEKQFYSNHMSLSVSETEKKPEDFQQPTLIIDMNKI